MGYIRAASVGPVKTLCVRNVIDYNNDAEFTQTTRLAAALLHERETAKVGRRRTSVHGALLGGLFCQQRKARFGGGMVKDARAQVFSQRRAMFESMAGAAARDPYILKIRMLVDEKVTVPCVFVLAYAGLEDGSILQRRNVFLQIGVQTVERRFRDNTHASIGIKIFSVAIKGDFESTALDIGQGIEQIRMRAMQPDRHPGRTKICVAGRTPEKKNLLPRGKDTVAQQLREKLRQPWAATVDKCARGD